MPQLLYDYGNGIYGVDACYEREGLVSIHFLLDSGRAAIMDTAHNAALEPALRAMKQLGLQHDQVDHIFISHVHLDHAGGAGLFMKEFEQARLVMHPRGMRHMIDPSRLMEGVRAVYGPEETERLYGEPLPVAENRIIAAEDGLTVEVGARSVMCFDTPGHAKHHMSFMDSKTNAVFTGDAFGMSYPQLDTGSHQGIIATTSPTQFDPNEMLASMDKIMALKPTRLYPTHFGEIRDPGQAERELKRQIDEYVRIGRESGGDFGKIHAALTSVFAEEAKTQNWPEEWRDIAKMFKHEIVMNAKGVKSWYDHEMKKR